MEVAYTFRPGDYLVDVSGRVTGAGAGGRLLTELGSGLGTHEAKPDRFRNDLAALALSADGVEVFAFKSVEGSDSLGGPLTWAAVKDKYFLAALVAGGRPAFTGMTAWAAYFVSTKPLSLANAASTRAFCCSWCRCA